MTYKRNGVGIYRWDFNKTDSVRIDNLSKKQWCVELWVYGVHEVDPDIGDEVEGLRVLCWPVNLPTLSAAKACGNFMHDVYMTGHQHGWHNGHGWSAAGEKDGEVGGDKQA